MSIAKDYGEYYAVCDICGEVIGPCCDFYDAVDAKRRTVGSPARMPTVSGLTFAQIVRVHLRQWILEV